MISYNNDKISLLKSLFLSYNLDEVEKKMKLIYGDCGSGKPNKY